MAKLKDSIKKSFYQNVKPLIDKVETNPYLSSTVHGLSGGIPGAVYGAINSYLYRPDFDARNAKTQDEAYKMARKTGAKTFIWNGKHYNTDYKGNPKKTLVQQKQEELDTYGITNEYTRNRNLFEDRLLKNLFPYNYDNPIKRVFNATILNKIDSDKNSIGVSDVTKRRDDEFGMLLGKPQQNNTFAISKYKPTKGATKDYYFKYKDDNAMIKRYPAEHQEEFFNNTIKNIELYESGKLKPGEYSYNDSINTKKWKDIRDKFHDIDSNAEYDPIDKTVSATSYLDRESGAMMPYGNINLENNTNQVIPGSNVGDFTIGKTDDYVSYYDKWDINPFGYGNDKALYQLGTPLNIYDRKYFDENNTKKSLGGDIMIKKKLNKFVVPREYNQSAIFAKGGNLYGVGDYLSIPKIGVNVPDGPDLSSITTGGVQKLNAASKTTTTMPQTPGVGAYLGAAQGVMQLGSQAINSLDTSGIGNEVVGTNEMSRNDILNTNVNVDSKQSNVGGQALSGAMTGAQAGMALGPLGAGIGAGVGLLAGGISSIIGNNKKQKAADLAEQQWTNNLEAKNRQFQGQDLRTSMANFSAMGGDLFAYGGNIESNSPLTEFNSGKSHQENPNGGILQGTGANGQPNLVEEGETKHEDYIFSDRLKINPQISRDFKLPKGLNGKTFADASKYLNREAKDRPNDPISKNGVKAHLAKLTAAQEGLKAQQQSQQGIPMEGQPNANMLAQGYANGGFIDQTHYQNPTLQGANIGAEGMPLTKLNTPLVGIDQNTYARSMKLQGVDWRANPLSNVKDINEALKEAAAFRERNPYQQEEVQSTDYSRYAPVTANLAMGISDMFEKPEVVKFGRVNPERITARMDYQPIDTEWMNNKMNATYAGTRDQMINQAGGNRAMAMAGLSGINQQQQNAVGEAYMKAQDINYGRKNQAAQFNAGIEAQNVAAQNAAQQTNLQLQMQEMDASARNRAAKRNAARQAILNAASNVGDIGRENYNRNTVKSSTGYGYKDDGSLAFDVKEGTIHGNQIYKKGQWVAR